MPEVYEELRQIAEGYLRRERPDHTLEPAGLVHEAYLKLSAQSKLAPNDRRHFLAMAAGAMRQILVDHARAANALKRGGGWQRITVSEAITEASRGSEHLLTLDAALQRLAAEDEVAAFIVEMRFFAGLTEVEIAAELGRSERWVRGQWSHARAWLRRQMAAEEA
ncbi:MAG: sigma-70 family RNA polymerase sigma factor [Candidatus Eisenbacteria bacterium]|nr:sigma-70 family RNA polymerase sigma factor [Candidatus Eisenbacteria bacterium]